MEYTIVLVCQETTNKINKFVKKTQNIINNRFQLSLRSFNNNYGLQLQGFLSDSVTTRPPALVTRPPALVKLHVKSEVRNKKTSEGLQRCLYP